LVSAFLAILVLATLSEEILFRGVLLNVFHTSRPWTLWVGVVNVALIFATVHSQYRDMSTLAEMMALSAIFAWARIRSGGSLLPVLLHALSSVLGVLFTVMS
jgi:membrane protease YdiL (CAAX protease family)